MTDEVVRLLPRLRAIAAAMESDVERGDKLVEQTLRAALSRADDFDARGCVEEWLIQIMRQQHTGQLEVVRQRVGGS